MTLVKIGHDQWLNPDHVTGVGVERGDVVITIRGAADIVVDDFIDDVVLRLNARDSALPLKKVLEYLDNQIDYLNRQMGEDYYIHANSIKADVLKLVKSFVKNMMEQ